MSRLKTEQICFQAASPSGTPTAKVTTAAVLNYNYITCGDRHLITILTFGTRVDILYYLFSLGQLILNSRLPQVLPSLGYNTRLLVLLLRLPQALPRLRLQRPQP